jgi:hypothetical protein
MAYFEKPMEFASNILIIPVGVLLNMLISSVYKYLFLAVRWNSHDLHDIHFGWCFIDHGNFIHFQSDILKVKINRNLLYQKYSY